VPSPLGRLQQALLSCVNAPAQLAALAALTGPQEQMARMRDAYRERRDRLVTLLERLGVSCHRPAGAFYAWVNVADRAPSARQFALELLRHRRVAVAPAPPSVPPVRGGSAFPWPPRPTSFSKGHAAWRGSRSVDLGTAPATAAGHASGDNDLDVG
jgi:DNA-binding transcriptional MocR family regulator